MKSNEIIQHKNIAVLGSTGSIGTQTLDIIAEYPDRFTATVLVAGSKVEQLIEQAIKFRPRYALIADESKYAQLHEALSPHGIETAAGAQAIADVMTLHGEEIDDSKPYEIFHPIHTWKKKTVSGFKARKLLVKIFDKGRCVYKNPSLAEIKEYCKEQINTLWDEVLRFENPHKYYVDLSYDLWEMKNSLLEKNNSL